MRFLFVTKLDRYARAINTITNYATVAPKLGHEVALYGEEQSDHPRVPTSLDLDRFDFVIFVVYETTDFPDLPYLARLLDTVPKERRVVIDCCGRYNDTIRIEHDFNHLEKLDGHQGWEWVEGFQAISDTILQPTLRPRRDDVRCFLFHAFDPSAVTRAYASADEAAQRWALDGDGSRPYGVVYVGNNWQRWSQIAKFLQQIEPIKDKLGPTCLAGWGWDERPEWAIELGLRGVDVDPDLVQRVAVETRWGIPFDEISQLAGEARFAPVFHRPLFNELGLVTNRTFETFTFDALPLLFLGEDLVEAIHGPDALPLVVREDAGALIQDAFANPGPYWQAVLKTRDHLAEHHSYERRFGELVSILGE
jgi:hypothetical protein